MPRTIGHNRPGKEKASMARKKLKAEGKPPSLVG